MQKYVLKVIRENNKCIEKQPNIELEVLQKKKIILKGNTTKYVFSTNLH